MGNPITAAIGALTGNITGSSGQQPPSGEAKVCRYRCIENCTFMGKYRKAGDIVILSEEKTVPHFEIIVEEKNDPPQAERN